MLVVVAPNESAVFFSFLFFSFFFLLRIQCSLATHHTHPIKDDYQSEKEQSQTNSKNKFEKVSE